MTSARILVISPTAFRRDNTLWIECARRFRNIHVVVPDDADVVDWPDIRAVSRLPTLMAGHRTRQWPRGLRDVIDQFEPDLVHVVAEPWAPVSQRVAQSGIPFAIHSAESVLADAPLPYKIRRIGMNRVLQRSAGHVTWGRTGLEAIRSAGLPTTKPTAIVPAAPPDPASFAPSPARVPDGSLHVAFVGRLVPQKGVADLIRACADPRLRDITELRILGDGPQASTLKGIAAASNESVHFLGEGDARAVNNLLRWSDVLVVPSVTEPTVKEQWGRVIVEAMLVGRAIVGSDSGELPFLVGDPAMTFPEGDHLALAELLASLATDPTLLARRQQEARARASQYRPDTLADTLSAFWQECLAFSGRPSLEDPHGGGPDDAH